MCRRLNFLTSLILVLGLAAGVAVAGIDYGDPDGGWAYIYTGDAAAADLDGTWDHDNGSDQWDESEIGAGRPGGVSVLSEAGTTYVRLQETGDPSDHGMGDPGSNRKIFFTHDLTNEIDQSVADEILSVGGITLSFRVRLPTTPPLDDMHPDGGGAITPWPAEGDGYGPHNGGKSVLGIHQDAGGDQCISFALALATDPHSNVAAYMNGKNGLNMNALSGTSPSGDVDAQDNDGTPNVLELDPTQWHEFWITIEPDTSGGGTHKVNIYVDGSSTANVFHITAGDEGDESYSYILLGLGGTPQSGAIDVDFFAYAPGIISPTPSNPNLARAVNPPNGATVALPDATPLIWTAGESAAGHDVYFGTDEADVNDADTTDTTGVYRGRQNPPVYTPSETIELGQTYYWRIDEVEDDGTTIHRGAVWSFTIIDHLLVDDFEDYDAGTNEIWWSWHDGLGYVDVDAVFHPGNGTGSEVGDGTTPSFTEETIVHGGGQSMPYLYDNNKADKAKYSEAKKTLTETRDWTEQGVKALSLWFRGYPPFLGGFTEAPAGTYTMTADGANIEDQSDEFHFAFQELSGAGMITAKVESVQNTHAWAKAGVMIRDSLDADSAHAMVAVTPGNGIWFGRRTATGNDTDTEEQGGITAPYWVRVERTVGGLVRAYYSADGNTWDQLGASVPVTMSLPMYAGLALTSHSSGVKCEAVFSNVTSDGTGPWVNQDIGMNSNEAERMYVAIANNNGTTGTVYYDDNENQDPNATLIDTWTEWNIDLKDFSDQGVDLTDVNSIAIGFGDRDNPQAGGTGKMYFDDIRLYQPRYVADKVTRHEADFTDDGIVDFEDLQIMINDWLQGDYTISATTPQPAFSWWKFDNNANDSAGNINGTLVGNPTYVAGKFGDAISLDGDDYVNFGNPSQLDFATDNWSVSAWIKTTMTGTGDENKGTIFAKGGDQTDGIRYTLAVSENSSGTVTLTTDDNDAKRQAISTSTVNDDVWHHVAGIRDGTALRVYVDGTMEGTATAPDGYDLGGASQHNAYVGVITDNRDGSLIKPFVGLIDDVRIYNYALSTTDIMGVMGLSELYVPLTSQANISDEEPINSKKVNFKDFAVLADEWLQELVWPEW
ncbi:MAG: LamG domain-containing protein [Phycisphaerales bacterium]|jgi:hypothetical protein